jgi:sortase A
MNDANRPMLKTAITLVTVVALVICVTTVQKVFSSDHGSSTEFSLLQRAESILEQSVGLGERSGGDTQAALPSRLQIPSINVNAAVQYIGINGRGNIGIPTNYKDVGWYMYGPTPGSSGNSIVVGHVDNALGLKGVFANLKHLKKGDQITVRDKDGVVHTFKVTGTAQVRHNSTVPELFASSRKSRLILITCDGNWIRELQTYSSRLVVFSELVSST